MAKVIRPAYPAQFSIGLLLLIFVLSFFLSAQIFEVSFSEMKEGTPVYFGMFLVSCAVMVVVLVLWEEFLFPIKIIPTEAGAVFRNHRNKLKTQVLIYCLIPVIYIFLYFRYEVDTIRFFIWATISIVAPVAGKLVSGINNYNDYLKVTNDVIEFRNNEKAGSFPVGRIQNITLMRDERNVLHNILVAVDGKEVEISIDEMELDAYYEAIDSFIINHYPELVRIVSSKS
jgi:hypothetical protein